MSPVYCWETKVKIPFKLYVFKAMLICEHEILGQVRAMNDKN